MTLDLSHAYNQIVLNEESRMFLTINTHRRLYRYTRLPFGIASAIFQKTMDILLQGMEGVFCYLDNILVSEKSEADYLHNLGKVQAHGVKIKIKKCAFMKPSVWYLGHLIDPIGLPATGDKLQAIVHAPQPKNVTELKSFLGLITMAVLYPTSLLSFILSTSSSAMTLTGGGPKHVKMLSLLQRKRLLHPNFLYIMILMVQFVLPQTHNYGISAVISHTMDVASELPIAFASRTPLPSEKTYSQIEKEALSLIFGVCKFHTYLYGRRLTPLY